MADSNLLSRGNPSYVSLSDGQARLAAIIEDLKSNSSDLNEADTRFQFIDRFITECLGWPRSVIRLEQPHNNTYTDYELGIPRQVIWEAKREGLVFELPAGTSKRLIQPINSLAKICSNAHDAILQAQAYCNTRGCPYAVVSNTHQVIIFLAIRTDGIPPLKGQCLELIS